MPNRILKESISTSETIDQLSYEEEVFFYRLMVACDDYGRIDARPAILRARCFPLRLDTVTDKNITQWLDSISQAGLIQLYIVTGKPYLKMITWDKHQQIRAKRSKHPGPEDADREEQESGSNGNKLNLDDIICPRNPNPNPIRNPNPINNVGDKSPDSDGVLIPGKQIDKCDTYSPEFEQFWSLYPRKVDKRKTLRNWQTRLKQGAKPPQMIAAAKHYSQACVGKEQQFVKHASTFLGPDKPYEEWIRAPAELPEAVPKAWNILKNYMEEEEEAQSNDG